VNIFFLFFRTEMATSPENWDGYLTAFRKYFAELNSTDPNRFPTGNDQLRKGN
jgi:hypothetical protein